MKLVEEADEQPDHFSDFLKVMKGDFSKPDKKDYYKIAYDILLEYFEQSKPSMPFSSIHSISNFKMPSIPNIAEQQRYNDQVKDKERLEYEIKFLETQYNEQQKVLIDYGRPNGIWGGMFVLIYSCVVGIAYPVTLLPYPNETFDDELTKWFLISLFISELLVLFSYLSFAMRKLTKDE